MITDQEVSLYTRKQLSNIYGLVEEIIDTLPDKALAELTSAYENDLDQLFVDLTRQVNFVINHNASKIDIESLQYQNEFRYHIDQQLKKHVLNYFTTTVLSNFDNHYRTLEWGNMVQKYPWSAYLCQRGSGKSMSPSELVVMYDGTYKQIKDIVVGDLVMGIDSTPRRVLSTHSGRDTMYRIEQANAENYTVNSEHILHYKRGSYVSWWDKKGTHRKKMIFDEDHTQIVEMSTKEFHKQSRLYKSQSFGYRVKGWELPARNQKIEPYFLGLWLGDGTGVNQNITNVDPEVIQYIYDYSDRLGDLFEVSEYRLSYKIKLKTRGRGLLNPLIEDLKFYNLLNNKHIPDDYLLGSHQQRLELLAGLIDSDGTTSSNKSSYSITQKNKELLEQIQRLCWSLGFRANLKERKKKLKYKNNEIYTSYDLYFSGDVWDIPCKIKRKRIEKYDRVQDSQRSKLNSVELGEGDYCGFECDGDKLFLLKDGTVVHNSYFYCYAFPLWRLYSYDPPQFLTKDTVDNKNRKETCLITNTFTLVKDHAKKIVEEIQRNPILSEKLVDKSSSLGKDQIITKTGSTLHLRSKDSMIRGLHVGASVTDDFLDKSAIYSKEQRDKFHEIFYAETKNIVEQGGYNIVSGCVSPETIVTTNKGLRYIGDLCPNGDYKIEKKMFEYRESICGRNGFNNTSHYWCNGESENYNIITKFGYNLNGSSIHPIQIMDIDGKMKWRKMPELNIGDYVCINIGQGFGEQSSVIDVSQFVGNKKSIATKIKVDSYLNRDWLYFFGLWIADGNFDKTKSGFTITKNNKGIREFILSGFNDTKFKERKNDEIKMDFSSVELKELFDLVECNTVTALNKTVPKKIFESNKESIKYFLQGLFDGDGCFYSDKNGNNQINLSSISKELINQVQVILLHFGICSSVKNKGISISEKVIGKHDLYSLNITGYDVKLFIDEIGFRYSGKGIDFIDSSCEVRSEFRTVPFQSSIFKKIRKEKGRVKRGYQVGKLDCTQSIYSKQSSKVTLKKCLQYFIDNGAKGENIELAKQNLYNNYIFLPIEKIEKNKGWTVDFVIPNDHSFLSNGIISHNTPFHIQDLYGDLKQDPMFKVFEYPGIFPNGDLLAPDRFSFKYLMDLRKSLGSIIFAREVLVTPVSDASSLFPWAWLERSFIGMENISFVDNISSYPFRMKKVVIGCDFAKSANIGADYTVFSVIGMDDNENYYYINVWRKQGASVNEMVNKLVQMDHAFRPNKIVCEANGFQSLIPDMVKQRGLKNIEEFVTTGSNKKDLYSGLPSLSAIFERGNVRIPYREGETRDLANIICGEFNSISFNEDSGKLESADQNDDCAMSGFIAIHTLRSNNKSTGVYYV